MRLPGLGLGTWHMGERRALRAAEADVLRLGLDLGMRLVDTAEMYGEGGAEEVVAEAIRGRRDEAFVVSKFYPHHAGRRERVRPARPRSPHWGSSGSTATSTTGAGRCPCRDRGHPRGPVVAGRIASWGVSNSTSPTSRAGRVPGGSAWR